MRVSVVHEEREYKLAEWGEFVCTHPDVTILKGEVFGSEWLKESYVRCLNRDCTGIQEHEIDRLLEVNHG